MKVGDRVRRVVTGKHASDKLEMVPIGEEGTVIQDDGFEPRYEVRWDSYGPAWAFTYTLAPLTDPRAQEFIEDMERFAVLNPRIKVDPVVAERLCEFDRNFTD